MIKKKIIEKNVVDVLKEKGLTITTAESCTGGLVAATIVNISGASAVFKEGYITYSNEAKIKLLGVKPETLERYYAVSRETAIEIRPNRRETRILGARISVMATFSR